MEWDPLLEQGRNLDLSPRRRPDEKDEGKVIKSAQKSLRKAETVGIVVIPMILFVTNIQLWTLQFHRFPFVILCLQVGFLTFSAMVVIIFKKENRYLYKLGSLLLVTVVTSFLAGFYTYYRFTIYYSSYEDLRVYTNVQATQPSNSFQDSGMLEFSRTTHVDTTRAVGFQSYQNNGRVFCIAPVMEQGMGLDKEVGFWAVGTDCCAPRSHFECGWANDPQAHSGVILLKDELIAPQALGWVLNWVSDRPWYEYERAMMQQNAVFGTKAAQNHILLHWERYPLKIVEDFRRSGLKAVMNFSMLYFIGLIVIAIFHQNYTKMQDTREL